MHLLRIRVSSPGRCGGIARRGRSGVPLGPCRSHPGSIGKSKSRVPRERGILAGRVGIVGWLKRAIQLVPRAETVAEGAQREAGTFYRGISA